MSEANITDAIRRHALAEPLADAVVRQDGGTISYRDLDRAIDGIAAGLADQGIRPGAVVRVETPNAYRHLVARLALARMGAAFAPETLPEDALDAVLGLAAGASTVRQLSLKALWENWVDSGRALPASPAFGDSFAVAGFFPTSGTTGVPRHVAVSHEALELRLRAWGESPAGAKRPRELCTIGAGTVYGFTTRLRTLWQGGAIVISNGDRVLAALDRYRVTRLVTAPNTLQTLLERMPSRAPRPASLDQIETSGAMLPDVVYAAARDRLCPDIFSGYGSTEVGWTALAPASSLLGRPGAVGRVVPGVEIEVVGPRGESLPAGEPGVLRIRGATCVHSYYRDPEASAEVFRDGWFYPGDEARIEADGMLVLVGRTSEVINKGGAKINPRTVEEVLLSAPGVRDAAAFGVTLPSGATRLWAAVVLAGEAQDPDALRALCRERLQTLAPDGFLQLKAIPRNEMGKIKRPELAKLVLGRLARGRQGGQRSARPRKQTLN